MLSGILLIVEIPRIKLMLLDILDLSFGFVIFLFESKQSAKIDLTRQIERKERVRLE
jgi:flagellar motor switch protein FliM